MKNLIIGATIAVAITQGAFAQRQDSYDFGLKHADEYWAARGYYRNDYGTVYHKREDITHKTKNVTYENRIATEKKKLVCQAQLRLYSPG
jgi:hypothetical protein